MKKEIITEVLQRILPYLNNHQLDQLKSTVDSVLTKYEIADDSIIQSSEELTSKFIEAKRIEGCSEKTLNYYRKTITDMLSGIEKEVMHITTEDLRKYLTDYQEKKKISKVTVDNIRRILSSFFSWLEDEDYILKSPVRRIHKVKTTSTVKEPYTDEALEHMKKIHLQNYLESRTDNDEALFVTLKSPHTRLTIGGVEVRIRGLGKSLGMDKVHPHKFRRTLATVAIDKGMPIEQLKQLLGHKRIDTTLQYAMVKQSNVKNAHRKYIG